MIPRIFEGETVAIVAGGPSLRGFDFGKLAGANVIAINRALDYLPDATVLWWTDATFFRMPAQTDQDGRYHPPVRDAILAHRAPYKATASLSYRPDELPAGIDTYELTGVFGLDDRPGMLRHGNNGAFAAMGLAAAQLGAARLVLFGVDMKFGPAGESHFHGGYPRPNRERTLHDLMLPHFGTLVEPLRERGVEVVNASPESALTLWPRCGIEDGLTLLREKVAA